MKQAKNCGVVVYSPKMTPHTIHHTDWFPGNYFVCYFVTLIQYHFAGIEVQVF